jgi:hypothetical protein
MPNQGSKNPRVYSGSINFRINFDRDKFKKKSTPELIEKFRTHWEQGLTYREIAYLCKISIRSAMYWRAALGLPNRSRGRRKS